MNKKVRWPGRPSDQEADDLVAIGKIIKPHGVRGEMRTEVLTDFPERFEETEEVHLIPPPSGAAGEAPAGIWLMELESARSHHGRMLIRLKGVDTMDKADLLRNFTLAVPQDELVLLEEGEYWHWQLEGLEAYTLDGQKLGVLREVLNTPAHDLYCIATGSGEVLIPAVDDYVHEVDLEKKRIVVSQPVIE